MASVTSRPLTIVEAKPRRQRHSEAERALLKLLLKTFRALTDATWRERNELRTDLHRAIDHFFGERLSRK